MSMSSLELLSFAARRLIQFETRFYRETVERRQALSIYFQQLASVILGLRLDLERRRLPHAPARELARLASHLADHVELELGGTETERLRLFLEQASDTERIYREYQDQTRSAFYSEELEKAAILLQALGDGLFLNPMPENSPPLSLILKDPSAVERVNPS